MPATAYLHGFASSPDSTKARWFAQGLADLGPVVVPDFNQPDFTSLSVGRMLSQTADAVAGLPPDVPVLLVASSMGGYVATQFVAQGGRADWLVLLAPALDLADLWRSGVNEADRAAWAAQGTWPIEHYGYKRHVPLRYGFYEEALQLPANPDASRVPTLILHGQFDETVPLRISLAYQALYRNTRLEVLATDHQMSDVLPELLDRCRTFVLS